MISHEVNYISGIQFTLDPKINFVEAKEPVKEEKKFLDINNSDSIKKDEPVQKTITKEAPPVTSKNIA